MSKSIDVLTLLMRPPGGGIPVFSAGLGAASRFQQDWYRVADDAAVDHKWRADLQRLSEARVVLIGVPSDTGAGIRRGAAQGPRAVREALMTSSLVWDWRASGRLIDLGDIWVNPHLLHDSMLSDAQILDCQAAMYPSASDALRRVLPVSPLSQLAYILRELYSAYPQLKVFVIGGDHSCAWPVAEQLALVHPRGELAIVQPDAHTDLLPSRLGVKYCFGTWSHHANQILGGAGRLVQLGIRQSGRDRGYWESTQGVRQFWASELRSMKHDEAIEAVIGHLRSVGAKKVYFSNDIDGTDESEAAATGTPVPEGLSSVLLLSMIDAIGKEFDLVAADLMEVAPDLARSQEERTATCRLSAAYVEACLNAMINR